MKDNTPSQDENELQGPLSEKEESHGHGANEEEENEDDEEAVQQ